MGGGRAAVKRRWGLRGGHVPAAVLRGSLLEMTVDSSRREAANYTSVSLGAERPSGSLPRCYPSVFSRPLASPCITPLPPPRRCGPADLLCVASYLPKHSGNKIGFPTQRSERQWLGLQLSHSHTINKLVCCFGVVFKPAVGWNGVFGSASVFRGAKCSFGEVKKRISVYCRVVRLDVVLLN